MDEPTDGPTDEPTDGPTDDPTDGPTDDPTDGPTNNSLASIGKRSVKLILCFNDTIHVLL